MGDSDISIEDLFGGKAFGVENAFSMYATHYVHMPAKSIYEKDAVSEVQDVIDLCHIYLIGYTPIINVLDVKQTGLKLGVEVGFLDQTHEINFDIANGMKLLNENGLHFVEDSLGYKSFPTAEHLAMRLCHETQKIHFNVNYVGQAFGRDGKRNALDRLLKHETLQKISLEGAPDSHYLSILMLGIEENNQLLTLFNPHAKEKENDDQRISDGITKALETSEAERVTLFEASLIRYFMPRYNKEFKNSFPSTNLKVLTDCYDKDFSAVCAEIYIDDLPYYLCSETVEPSFKHTAFHHLHDDDERKVFFGL